MGFDGDIGEFTSIAGLKFQLKRGFSKIKQEFTHHREAINENTNEIQANYEYITELESRIEKLKEKIDEMQMFLKSSTNYKVDEGTDKYQIQPLSVNEKRVFIILYTSPSLLTYNDIAHALNISESLGRSYSTNLIEKGVPIVKKYVAGKPYLSLDVNFKKAQAEYNIVKLQQKQLSNF